MATNPRRKSNAARRANQVIRSRTVLLMALLGVCTFLLLFWKLYDLQINQHEAMQEKAVNQQTRSAVITEMLAWESHYNVIDPLYENILGSKLIRDDGASAMLDVVFDSILFDIGLIWNFNDIGTKLLTNKDTNVASLLAGMSSAIEAEIQKLQETVKNMG